MTKYSRIIPRWLHPRFKAHFNVSQPHQNHAMSHSLWHKIKPQLRFGPNVWNSPEPRTVRASGRSPGPVVGSLWHFVTTNHKSQSETIIRIARRAINIKNQVLVACVVLVDQMYAQTTTQMNENCNVKSSKFIAVGPYIILYYRKWTHGQYRFNVT